MARHHLVIDFCGSCENREFHPHPRTYWQTFQVCSCIQSTHTHIKSHLLLMPGKFRVPVRHQGTWDKSVKTGVLFQPPPYHVDHTTCASKRTASHGWWKGEKSSVRIALSLIFTDKFVNHCVCTHLNQTQTVFQVLKNLESFQVGGNWGKTLSKYV